MLAEWLELVSIRLLLRFTDSVQATDLYKYVEYVSLFYIDSSKKNLFWSFINFKLSLQVNCQLRHECPDGLAGFKRGVQDKLNELRKERPKPTDYMIEDAFLSADAQSFAENITAVRNCMQSWNFYHSEYCLSLPVVIEYPLETCYGQCMINSL